MFNRKSATGAAFALAASFISVTAFSNPISVSYEGADVTVLYDIDGANSQKVSFDYIFAVGNATDAANWIGTTMDAFSVQFGSVGNNTLIDSISGTSSNSANVNGDWTGFLDKVSGNGCSSNTSAAACYTRLPTAAGGSGSETVIAADTTYTFEFDVFFKPNVDVLQTLAGNHSIKFLSVRPKNNVNNPWQTGLQLSESGPFLPGDPTDPDVPIPAPGTLLLTSLGLLGLRFLHRKRT